MCRQGTRSTEEIPTLKYVEENRSLLHGMEHHETCKAKKSFTSNTRFYTDYAWLFGGLPFIVCHRWCGYFVAGAPRHRAT